MIPRLIHFIWLNPPLPTYALINLSRFRALNPKFGMHVHGLSALHPKFHKAYRKIEGEHLWARRSDLVRLSVLEKHGGWYFDCDFVPIRPLRDIYKDHNNFSDGREFVTHGDYLDGKPLIANGVIGVKQGSTFLSHCYNQVVRRGRRPKHEFSWGLFGPDMFTFLVETAPQLVHIGHIDKFYPIRPRERSLEVYKRLRSAQFSSEAMHREFGTVLPYMMHMGMMDDLKV